MAQITYSNKVNINSNSSVADINKINDSDMNEIKTTVNTNTPVGSISMFAGSTAPNGWLICDGSAVSRTTYSNLFSVIGITYGSGDGSTTFNVPNLKGKVVVGYDSSDTSFDTIGETGGEKTHKLTIDEMPSHHHNTYGLYTNIGSGSNANTWLAWSGGNAWVQNAGGDQAHNNLQPYVVMNYIISY